MGLRYEFRGEPWRAGGEVVYGFEGGKYVEGEDSCVREGVGVVVDLVESDGRVSW